MLVAVSGGLDSIVLLDVLAHLRQELSFEIVVGHIDHGLRGTTSAHDAAFIQSVASAYGIEAAIYCLTSSDLKGGHDEGQEGAAREARLEALQRLADETGAARIALGHTLDDQAETILHHLARGTGPTGLRGMRPVRFPFIRPLLDVSRSDLHAYAAQHGLTWREDASNSDLAYTRNRIRHRLLPELRAINPRINEALGRMADLAAELDEATTFLVGEKLSQLLVAPNDSGTSMDRRALAALPDSLSRLILREAIRRARGSLEGIEFAHIDAICALVMGTRSHGQLSLPGLHIQMQQDELAFLPTPPEQSPHWSIDVDLGVTELPGGPVSLELEVVDMSEGDLASTGNDPWIEYADADRIHFPLRLRTRVPGDRFSPLGLGHEMKLKDFLINERTPPFDRAAIPLLCDSQAIIWVVGMRLSDTVKLSKGTQRVLMMRLKGVQ